MFWCTVGLSDLTIAPKLTKYHLHVKGSERQRVRPAVQLLSYTTSRAIEFLGENGFMSEESNWKTVSDFCKLFNHWFDLMNSKEIFRVYRKTCFWDWITNAVLLKRVSKTVASITVGKHKSLLPFQKRILSLEGLFDYLKNTYNVEYILTSRLNQNVLEFFLGP